MPSAKESSATPLTMGACRIWRTANLRSRTSDDTNPMRPLTRTFCPRLAESSESSGWCEAPVVRVRLVRSTSPLLQPLLTAFEGEGGPGRVDRAHLIVHPAGREA